MNEYPYIQELIDEGYEVVFNDTNSGRRLIIVNDDGGSVILFSVKRMKFDTYMKKLNEYAKEYLENGEHNCE